MDFDQIATKQHTGIFLGYDLISIGSLHNFYWNSTETTQKCRCLIWNQDREVLLGQSSNLWFKMM